MAVASSPSRDRLGMGDRIFRSRRPPVPPSTAALDDHRRLPEMGTPWLTPMTHVRRANTACSATDPSPPSSRSEPTSRTTHRQGPPKVARCHSDITDPGEFDARTPEYNRVGDVIQRMIAAFGDDADLEVVIRRAAPSPR